MTVYVDNPAKYNDKSINPAARRYGDNWCHLFSDDQSELRELARHIGCDPAWEQHPRKGVLPVTIYHFDLVPSKRTQAIAAGAVQVESMIIGVRRIMQEREQTE